MQRRVLIVVFPGFPLLDMAGPADVFGTATLIRRDAYQVEVGPVSGGHVTAGNGPRHARPRPGQNVARGLVVCLHRPGGQSQFSTAMRALTPRSEPLREPQGYIDANPAPDLSVPALAARAGMSRRHFSRVFRRHRRIPPGDHRRRFQSKER
ncbi:hypothetical protein ABZW11_25340 [Nonomuraea sp. NPDC004580]|uniref:hypothetical protein n=1 Tax=Nonomuraea sp. NPDC004580 TaxID=3154552 RepID=UPI0033AA058C